MQYENVIYKLKRTWLKNIKKKRGGSPPHENEILFK